MFTPALNSEWGQKHSVISETEGFAFILIHGVI